WLLSILAIICVCLPSNAQIGDLRNNLAIGLNGGINSNKVSFSPTIKQSTLIRYNGGITLRYISEKYMALICGIQTEINYTQRGWAELIEDDSGDTYSCYMNYVEIPILTHWAFGKEKNSQVVFLHLGPQVAFLLNEKENMSESWHLDNRLIKEQYGKLANKFDYGIIAGGGLEIKTKAGNFLIEGRYYYALSDFYNTTKKEYFGRAAHTTILGKMTYLFNITK
ncbi:hypothetical protein EZS27_011566, partial [termite gut metagenome]